MAASAISPLTSGRTLSSGRLSAASRLRKRSEFRAVQAQASRVVTRHFVFLLHMPNAAQRSPRLGITASRKVGNAVARNRAKRLVREAFRATRDLWQPGLDLVVIVRASLGEMKLLDVVSQWRSAEPALRRTVSSIARAHSIANAQGAR
ncbi:MAG TPA: ribonuclease P protein component [Polyangiaceae bacterium]|nr:ribonuclease P protein component [Polyangiaceae bacterium]